MIEFLQGVLMSKDALGAVIEVQGVGYGLHISFPTFEALPAVGEVVTLLTHLHVREDAMQLYGFISANERRLFRQLQTISGIGARVALNILSGISPEELRKRVSGGDVEALTRIPGIGKKTAERIIVELRDTFTQEVGEEGISVVANTISVRDEALMALLSLGYPRSTAEKALMAVLKEPNATNHQVSDVIKLALRHLN
jgi:Holliday junction DNA helicase RuvA